MCNHRYCVGGCKDVNTIPLAARRRNAFRRARTAAVARSISSRKQQTLHIERRISHRRYRRGLALHRRPETSTLGRTITWSSAYILVISRVIGSGIFATPGVIVKGVGSVGLSLSLWVVGAVIAACGLAVGLEYGCMLPRSGGEKVYLEFVYRKPRFLASTLVATQAVLLGFTASNCIVFSQYTLYAFDVEATDFRRKSLAVGLLTAITIVHSCFMKTGIRIQNFLGWIKIGLVVFMVFSGLSVVVFRIKGSDEVRSHFPTGSDIWKGSDWSWGIISTSLFKVFYSFAGLTNVNNVSINFMNRWIQLTE
jgi:amino acid transporter